MSNRGEMCVSEHSRRRQSQATDESDPRDDRSCGRHGVDAVQRDLDQSRAPEGLRRTPMPKELNGRDGPEPTRFGDWEVKGLATDF